MSGFNGKKVKEEFFPDENVEVNFMAELYVHLTTLAPILQSAGWREMRAETMEAESFLGRRRFI